jgi:hypothetical protein
MPGQTFAPPLANEAGEIYVAPRPEPEGELLVIQVNRCARFVGVNSQGVLDWTATSAANAEVFERIDVGNGQFKLRVISTGEWVWLDDAGNDTLRGDEPDENAASVFAQSACGTWSALSVPADADGLTTISVDGPSLTASRAACSANADSWERLELCPPDGSCQQVPNGSSC